MFDLTTLLQTLKAGQELLRVKNKYIGRGFKSLHGPFYLATSLPAYLSYLLFVYYNPFHYGEWIQRFPAKTNSLVDYQIELIKFIISQFGGRAKAWTGLINNGASEGNFHMMMLCKEWLLSQEYRQPVILCTELSHVSVFNSAKVLNLPIKKVKLDRAWQMDIRDVRLKLKAFPKNQAVCIFLTLGYKPTGTSDNLPKITTVAQEVFDSRRVCICIDAAFDALVQPFAPKPLKPLTFSQVTAISWSFSKYLGVPAPAGSILYQKKLLTKKTTFLANGIAETRSLVAPLAVWAAFHTKRQVANLREQIARAQSLRAYVIEQLSVIDPQIVCFYDSHNISLFISCNRKQYSALQLLSQEYPLRCFAKIVNQQRGYYVKIIFLPLFNKEAVDNLLASLS